MRVTTDVDLVVYKRRDGGSINVVAKMTTFDENMSVFFAMIEPRHWEDNFRSMSNLVESEVRLYKLSDQNRFSEIKDIIDPQKFSVYVGDDYNEWIDWGSETLNFYVQCLTAEFQQYDRRGYTMFGSAPEYRQPVSP